MSNASRVFATPERDKYDADISGINSRRKVKNWIFFLNFRCAERNIYRHFKTINIWNFTRKIWHEKTLQNGCRICPLPNENACEFELRTELIRKVRMDFKRRFVTFKPVRWAGKKIREDFHWSIILKWIMRLLANIMQHLWASSRQQSKKKVLFIYDNAPAHSSGLARQKLDQLKVQLFL